MDRRAPRTARMDNDAFAGFLRLMLTTPGNEPKNDPEVASYLRYVERVSPLSEDSRRRIGLPARRRAA